MQCQGELLLASCCLLAIRFGRTAQTGQASAQLPIAGVISDGQQSIRQAVKTALPEVAHAFIFTICEAAKGIYRQTVTLKKELKRKQVQGNTCHR